MWDSYLDNHNCNGHPVQVLCNVGIPLKITNFFSRILKMGIWTSHIYIFSKSGEEIV